MDRKTHYYKHVNDPTTELHIPQDFNQISIGFFKDFDELILKCILKNKQPRKRGWDGLKEELGWRTSSNKQDLVIV